MNLKGTVQSVIFYNAENGYTVLQLQRDKESIICVGFLPAVSEGEILTLTGEMTSHAKFGEQFSVTECIVASPQTIIGIERYLASGLIKGLGPATAKAIVGRFKKESLKILEDSPELLSSVKGISKKKALAIGDAYKGIKEMQEQIVFLQGYNMTINLAMKIYNVYKQSTIETVKSNPYKLISDVDGVGFITADRIAQSIGYEFDSDFRIRAGIVHCLQENADKNGNTYMKMEDIILGASKLLRIDVESLISKIENVLQHLELEMMIKRLTIENDRCISLMKYYNTERSIAGRLIKLIHAVSNKNEDTDLISHFESLNNIKLHELQRAAIQAAVNEGVSVITGGPGTGKTTIIKCVCYLFECKGLKPLCVTPTGRAAKRMQQATGQEAKTIHRALEMQYRNGMYFAKDENNPLDADVIIVDEMSMVDVFVFNALIKAIRPGARMVLVGDKDQLPSVGAGNVLSDIIRSGFVKINYLTYIYRQADDSLIISNAHLINECEMPVINNKSSDFFYMSVDSPEQVANLTVELVCKRLPKFGNLKPSEIQVLSPMKAGVSGVENINALLQSAINPPSKSKNQIKHGNTIFRVGDKVMQTTNDYQVEWYKELCNGQIESGDGVFNGDLGFISDVTESGLTVIFEDNRVVEYGLGDLVNLMLAYCITIHKSQGSEFDMVVIALMSGPPTILNKNLLYTAVTRAKKSVVIVGNRKHLYAMVKNNYIITRNTLLDSFLVDEEKKYKMYFD
ncbi:MAG: ATP-dependent RecD-like DNA helicase [Clostridia bacterium]